MQEIHELKETLKNRREDIVKIGQLLKAIKESKSYKERTFYDFLKSVGINERTASYYMRIAELENAKELISEIGYTKLITLLETDNFDEEHLNLAKTLSVPELRKRFRKPKSQNEVEEVKKEIKRIVNSKDMETFKKAFVEAIKEIKGK